MRGRNPVLVTVLVIVGGTIAARHFKPLAKVPGFSPGG